MTDHPHPHRGDRLSEGPGGRRAPGCGPSRTAGVTAVRIFSEPTGTARRLARLVEMGLGADLAARAEVVVARARRAPPFQRIRP